MKNIKIILAFILGFLISSLGVYAITIDARNTAYDNTNSGSSATNMQDAIDDLYEKAGKGGIGEALIPIMNGYSKDGITVSSPSENTPVWYAFDGNDSTQWTTAYATRNSYIQIDFGKPRTLCKVEAMIVSYNTNSDTQVWIEVSEDGTNWRTTTDTYHFKNTSIVTHNFYLFEENVRYLRFNESDVIDYKGVWTLQVYGY